MHGGRLGPGWGGRIYTAGTGGRCTLGWVCSSADALGRRKQWRKVCGVARTWARCRVRRLTQAAVHCVWQRGVQCKGVATLIGDSTFTGRGASVRAGLSISENAQGASTHCERVRTERCVFYCHCDLCAAFPPCLCSLYTLPWLVQVSRSGTIPKGKGSPVRFPAQAHAWAAGRVPGRGV